MLQLTIIFEPKLYNDSSMALYSTRTLALIFTLLIQLESLIRCNFCLSLSEY